MGVAGTTLTLVASIALLAVQACGDDDTSTPPADPDGTLVVYERGGGIAGVAERLEVRRDGGATLTVGVVDVRREELRLSADELDDLGRKLKAAEFEEAEPTSPDACADCFTEAITYAGRTTTLVAEIDEPPGSVSAVLAQLRELVAGEAG